MPTTINLSDTPNSSKPSSAKPTSEIAANNLSRAQSGRVHRTYGIRKTHIICVIDKSSSMHSIRDHAIAGFNAFLREQQLLGQPAILSLVLFDTQVRTIMNQVPLASAQPLSPDDYVPGGGTALLDALGAVLVNPTRHKSDQTIVVILTDGQENSSVEHTRQAVKSAISALEKTGQWQFQFLGANIDAFAEAGKLGLSFKHTADAGRMKPAAMQAMLSAASMNTRHFRETGDMLALHCLVTEELAHAENRLQAH
ncbi:MAG: vWA domain-containing protein [Burkholderiaceae bacterium]